MFYNRRLVLVIFPDCLTLQQQQRASILSATTTTLWWYNLAINHTRGQKDRQLDQKTPNTKAQYVIMKFKLMHQKKKRYN